MIKIASIVGARPQFIKAAAISRMLRQHYCEILIHTGQHYDAQMSDIFFKQLDIPTPEFTLNVGSGLHGTQTGKIMIEIEQVLMFEKPDWVIVYGDTNSTLAGALVAAKMNIPIIHVEAGERSFNREMPEEINRIVTDHIATVLLCSSASAAKHLASEGITKGVHVVGDVMHEALTHAANMAKDQPSILSTLNLGAQQYMLATIHRAENTNAKDKALQIFNAFHTLAQDGEVIVFPIHPRTQKMIMADLEITALLHSPNIRIIEPVGYLDMVVLQQNAKKIITDSGGVQKEAYWLGKPCITVRTETEWTDTVSNGWNIVTGSDTDRIIDAVKNFNPSSNRPPLYITQQSVAAQLMDIIQCN